jgi:hypothetical protein
MNLDLPIAQYLVWVQSIESKARLAEDLRMVGYYLAFPLYMPSRQNRQMAGFYKK